MWAPPGELTLCSPHVTPTRPACVTPATSVFLCSSHLPTSLKGTLNKLGVKSEKAGVGAVALREILSPKAAHIHTGSLHSSSAKLGKLLRLPCSWAPSHRSGAWTLGPPGITEHTFYMGPRRPFPEYLHSPCCPLLPSLARILVTLQVPPDKSLLLGGPPQSPAKHSAPASLSGLLMALLTCLSLICLVSVNAGRSQGPHFTQGRTRADACKNAAPLSLTKTQPQKVPRACGRLAADPRPGSLVI